MRSRLVLAALATLAGVLLLLPSCGGSPGAHGGCPAGQTSCGGTCTSTDIDPANCGACGTACPSGQACVAGACAAGCPSGSTLCGSVCVDTSTDDANCGGCGMACMPGHRCDGTGTCSTTCATGYTPCGDVCADTMTDASNCGACGTACPGGQVCTGGSCACPTSAPDACGGGTTGFCTDLMTDPKNCGACGTTCNAGQLCAAGTCTADCPPDYIGCPVRGSTSGPLVYCALAAGDSLDCGGCNIVCPAGTTCMGTTCKETCAASETNCGTYCADTLTDSANCGACGKVCGTGQSCVAGACACPDGTAYCADNGCTPVSTNDIVCGTAGVNCTSSLEICVDGTCVKPQPVPDTLASGQTGPRGLAVDGTGVYWANYDNSSSAAGGTIVKSSLSGGVLTTLSTEPLGAEPQGLATDGTYVYWTDFGIGEIRAVAVSGSGCPYTLATGESAPWALAVDATNVYWVDYTGTGTVRTVGKAVPASCTGTPPAPTTLASGQAFPIDIAVDANNVYWVDYGNSGLDGQVMQRALVSGAKPVTLASGLAQPVALALDSRYVYFTENGPYDSITGKTIGAIDSEPIGGGVPYTVLVEPWDHPGNIAVDSTALYWTGGHGSTGGNIVKMPLCSRLGTALATGLAYPYGIAVDDQRVFWTDDTTSGQVQAMFK